MSKENEDNEKIIDVMQGVDDDHSERVKQYTEAMEEVSHVQEESIKQRKAAAESSEKEARDANFAKKLKQTEVSSKPIGHFAATGDGKSLSSSLKSHAQAQISTILGGETGEKGKRGIGIVKGEYFLPFEPRSLFFTAINVDLSNTPSGVVGIPLTTPKPAMASNPSIRMMASFDFKSPICLAALGERTMELPDLTAKNAIFKLNYDGYDVIWINADWYLGAMQQAAKVVGVVAKGSVAKEWTGLFIGPMGLTVGDKFPSGTITAKFGPKHSWNGSMRGFIAPPPAFEKVLARYITMCWSYINKVSGGMKEEEFKLWFSMMLYAFWNDIEPLKLATIGTNVNNFNILDPEFPLRTILSMDRKQQNPSFLKWLLHKETTMRPRVANLIAGLRFFQYAASLIKEFFPNNPETFTVEFWGSLVQQVGDNLDNTLKMGRSVSVAGSGEGIWLLPGKLVGGRRFRPKLSPVSGVSSQYSFWDASGAHYFDYASFRKNVLEKETANEGRTVDPTNSGIGVVPDPDILGQMEIQVGGKVEDILAAIPANHDIRHFYTQHYGMTAKGIKFFDVDASKGEQPFYAIFANLAARHSKSFDFKIDSWFSAMLGASSWPKGDRALMVYSEHKRLSQHSWSIDL